MNEMTNHPVSVIVCTYNRAERLPRVIKELCAQNYPQDAFEIIIIDNCSTDNTPEIVQEYKCSLLRYVRENQQGVSFARNRGAEEAKFPYLAYLDDDCSVDKNWLSELISGFDLDEEVSIVAGRVELAFDDQKIPAWVGAISKRWLAEFNFPGSEPRLLDNPDYICEGNMAISKRVWQSVGGFLGMDQFGSPHLASQEIVYLLEQIKARRGKVAFVPNAAVEHHTFIPTQRQMLTRAYFHGVSSGILSYLLKGFSWGSVIVRVIANAAASFLLFFLSLILFFDKAISMDFLLRAFMRLGRVLSELRLVGNWDSVRAWETTYQGKG